MRCLFTTTCDNFIHKVIVCAGQSILEHKELIFCVVGIYILFTMFTNKLIATWSSAR